MMMHILFYLIFLSTVLLKSFTFSLKEILYLQHADDASESVFSVIFTHFLISVRKKIYFYSLFSVFFVEIIYIRSEGRRQ